MKTRFFFLLMLLAVGQSGNDAAVTVDVSGRVEDASATFLPDGNRVRVGYFDTSGGFDIAANANANNWSSLDSRWTEFSFASTKTVFSQAGTIADNLSSSSSFFNSKQIYLWIFKTSDNSAPQADYSNVQEQGIFSSTLGTWSFPVQGSTPPGDNTIITGSDVDLLYFGKLDGSFLQLNAVPEPAGLAVAAGLGMLFFALVRKLRARF